MIFSSLIWRNKTLVKVSLILVLMCVTQCIRVVPKDTIAVTRVLGFVAKDTLVPGAYVTNPLRRLTLFSTKTQTFEHVTTALTKNGLSVSFKIKLSYRIVPKEVRKLYVNIGPNFVEKFIKPELDSVIRKIASDKSLNDLEFMNNVMAGLLKDGLIESIGSKEIEIDKIELL